MTQLDGAGRTVKGRGWRFIEICFGTWPLIFDSVVPRTIVLRSAHPQIFVWECLGHGLVRIVPHQTRDQEFLPQHIFILNCFPITPDTKALILSGLGQVSMDMLWFSSTLPHISENIMGESIGDSKMVLLKTLWC